MHFMGSNNNIVLSPCWKWAHTSTHVANRRQIYMDHVETINIDKIKKNMYESLVPKHCCGPSLFKRVLFDIRLSTNWRRKKNANKHNIIQ